jgi:hypothetical protein
MRAGYVRLQTHTDNLVIHIAFPQQQWLYERASILRYMQTACLVFQWDRYKNCTLCKMGHQHILRFMRVPRFTTILLVGGLGVEDREIYFCQVPIVLHVIYFFVGFGRLPVKTKSTLRTVTTNSKYFCRCSSQLLKEQCLSQRLPSFRSLSAKCWRLCSNLALSVSVWALKSCKKSSNAAILLEDTATKVYVFILQLTCW